MSDTTKINKARVNGVLYDLGGSGSGDVSGYYMLPATGMSEEQLGISQYDIDFEALGNHLAESGVDLDEPILREEETEIRVELFQMMGPSSTGPFIAIHAIQEEDQSRGIKGTTRGLTKGGNSNFWTINVFVDNTIYSVFTLPGSTEMGLGDLLNYIQEEGSTSGESFYTYSAHTSFDIFIVNSIYINRVSINDVQVLPATDMNQIFVDIIVDAGGSSGEPVLPGPGPSVAV